MKFELTKIELNETQKNPVLSLSTLSSESFINDSVSDMTTKKLAIIKKKGQWMLVLKD